MSNVHRFKPRPKAPPPRRPLPFARSAWLPWALVVASAVILMLVGAGGAGTAIAAVLVVAIGGWLEQRA